MERSNVTHCFEEIDLFPISGASSYISHTLGELYLVYSRCGDEAENHEELISCPESKVIQEFHLLPSLQAGAFGNIGVDKFLRCGQAYMAGSQVLSSIRKIFMYGRFYRTLSRSGTMVNYAGRLGDIFQIFKENNRACNPYFLLGLKIIKIILIVSTLLFFHSSVLVVFVLKWNV